MRQTWLLQLFCKTFNLISKADYLGWTHVKEIPNTKLLMSFNHNYIQSANMEVFDVSKKGQPQKIYSLDTVCGGKRAMIYSYHADTFKFLNLFEIFLIF